tara:strand:+ start:904 stop:1236 length:333 start_codon:yes stop_codon:yes gene_type:complete
VSIVKRFANHLIEIEYPTHPEHWNIAGILKNKSNQHLKFDVRNMFKLPEGLVGKKGYTATKADKMVFETDKKWIILDVPEIHKYLKKHKSRVIYLDNLIDKLEWSTYISK